VTLGALLRATADRAPFPGASGLDLPAALAGAAVSSIAYDSRAVAPGAVFVAVRGTHADGATFAGDAIARGASVVVADTPAPAGIGVPWIQ
jgi:UDP-N-acetylmuramoyl-L-alanyl-D-glutamate--2,6-diaminopimelate ligase